MSDAPGSGTSPKTPGGGSSVRRQGRLPVSSARTTSAARASGTPVAEPQEVRERAKRYLVAALPAHRLPPGVAPADPDVVFGRLAVTPGVQVRRRLRPPQIPSAARHPHVAVVEMPDETANELARRPDLRVERNHELRFLTTATTAPAAPVATPPTTTPVTPPNPGTVVPAPPVQVNFLVASAQGDPLANATVMVMGSGWSAQGLTGTDGRTMISLPDGSSDAVSGVYVKPAYDYWERWLDQPSLSTETDNLVTLNPLSETFPGFPDRQTLGWGWSALGMDALPTSLRGQGVRVAIIDSGAAAQTHPDLEGRFVGGTDIVDGNDTGWTTDTVSHGTHCAGVIAAADNGVGVLGLAPDAEVYSCKIFPGGAFSELLEAIDFCLENAIDVVNLSLGSDQPSDLVTEKLAEARAVGMACVVAAGNDGGAVLFPGNLPTVFAVAAIGKTGQYPADTYHARQIGGSPDADGYFPAAFSCRGQEVDVSAPGVAILSSVPPANYAVWDGTSMATPYITGLAALVMAHHPACGPTAPHNGARVDQLFAIIKASCQPLDPVTFQGFGAGLPDATRALGLAAGSAPQAQTAFAPSEQAASPDLTPAVLGVLIGHVVAQVLVQLSLALRGEGVRI